MSIYTPRAEFEIHLSIAAITLKSCRSGGILKALLLTSFHPEAWNIVKLSCGASNLRKGCSFSEVIFLTLRLVFEKHYCLIN